MDGVKLDQIRKCKTLINKNEVEAFIEIHIEQGPILVDKNCLVFA